MASAPGTPPQSGKRSASPQSEVRRLLKAGARLFQEHQEPRALAAFKKAFLISRCLPEPPLRARCLFNLGAAYIYAGKPGKGLRCTRWARDMGVAEDGDLSFNIAAAYDALGGHAQAAEFYRRAAEQYEARQSLKAAEALVKLGYCLVSTGDPPSAALAFCRAGRAYQEAQRPEEAAMALREAANYWLRSGRYQPAEVLEALQGCSRLCAGITNLELLGHLRNHLGLHYTELQCFGHAEEQFREAMELCRGERCTLRKTAVLLQNMGALCNARLQPQAALPYHKQAAQAYGVLGETAARAQCLYNLATAHTQLGNYREALRDYQQAGKAFGDSGDASGEAQSLEGRAAAHLGLGHPHEAARCYKHALALLEKTTEGLGSPRSRILRKLAAVTDYREAARGPNPHPGGSVDSGADKPFFPGRE
ncbi:tetratricopeptide repeat protein 24-like isoform X3 [Paroedura picta]|uniref:tetratricopeptide repeat protein 24-like isoform X3 n=1 Tax=Paroedura picta TaxID=143630 RepID=UPI0040559C93